MSDYPGLKQILDGGWQRNFSSAMSCFWPVKILKKEVTNDGLLTQNISFIHLFFEWLKPSSWGHSYMFTKRQNLILQFMEFHCLLKTVCAHDWSTWPAIEVFGWSSHHSGRTLSVDRPLFWALQYQFTANWTAQRPVSN